MGVYRKPSWGLPSGDRKFAVVVFGIFDSWDPAGKEGPFGPGGRASGPSRAFTSAPLAFLLGMFHRV